MFSRRPLPRPAIFVLRIFRRLRHALDQFSADDDRFRTPEYRFSLSHPPSEWTLELCLPSGSHTDGKAWTQSQTLGSLSLYGEREETSSDHASLDSESLATFAFYAPGPSPPSVDPAFAETAALILAAENVDAVVLGVTRHGDLTPADFPEITDFAQLVNLATRRYTVYKASAWRYDSSCDKVEKLPRQGRPSTVKILAPSGVEEPAATPILGQGSGRGPRLGSYLSDHDFPPRPVFEIHDAASWPWPEAGDRGRDRMLVLVPFLARGGAEHTIFETLAALRDRWHIAFVTLAPHRPELADRRGDFQALWPHLYCLGDVVHPVAMPGMLNALLDAWQPSVIYNANGTTLFYDFVAQLRRPGIRIVDHLYDHRIGYINRYGEQDLTPHVDAIVAENRRIAETLVTEHGWPSERAPVVWPCGRPLDELPSGQQAIDTKARLRHQLGYSQDAVILLTAARMHPQKRPLDLVALATRLQDLPSIHFLVVGGGELEEVVDEGIAASDARIRRFPFRNDIPDLIAACDVGCLVSDYEGLPVFLLECLQSGVPFLGTNVGDLGHVVRATGAGWIVDQPGDLDGLEAAVRLLADSEERSSRAKAAAAAGPSFGVEACAARYDAVFRGLPSTDAPF